MLRGVAVLFGLVVGGLTVAGCPGAALGSGSSVEREVARLDTVHSAADRAIEEVAALGVAAVPFVVSRLESPRRMTALGAALVLREMDGDAVVAELLEHWAGLGGADTRTNTERAIQMVLRNRAGSAQTPEPGAVDRDLEALTRAAVCGVNEFDGACADADTGRGAPPLLVYGEGLGSGYELSCDGRAVQVLPSGAFRESEFLAGRDYVRVDAQIHELSSAGVAMPVWRATRGRRPDRVALVRVTCGRVGPEAPASESGSLWVRQGGRWSRLTDLFRMTVE